MPPNAIGVDGTPQDTDTSNTTQEGSTASRSADSERNTQSNNHAEAQNGVVVLPQIASALGTDQSNSYMPSVRCINVSSNLTNGSELTTGLEDSNATIYIIPNCDAPTTAAYSSIGENQIDPNVSSVLRPHHLFLLPSVPHPTSLNIPQPFPQYQQSAPPDYFATPTSLAPHTSTQPRLYTVAPYGDPPPEYESWSQDPQTIRESSHASLSNHQIYPHSYQQCPVNHPFQALSYAEELRGQNVLCRPASAASTSTLCCANNTNTCDGHDNLSTGCSLQAHCRNGCSICNNHCSGINNPDQVYNIGGNNGCGQSCHYQFPIHNDSNRNGITNEEQEGATDEEDYDRMTNTPSSPPEYLTIKRWVMVVLLLLLLTTFSLLLGISMQHFQLLKKFVFLNKSNDDYGDGMYRYHPKFGGKNNHRFFVTSTTVSTTKYLEGQISHNNAGNLKVNFSDKRKRDTLGPQNCNYIIDDPTQQYLKGILATFQSNNKWNLKLVRALCNTNF